MLGSGADLVGADLALASASHSGEPMHVERALAMLARAEVTEDDLGCPPALPMDDAPNSPCCAAGGGPRRIYMNCSGKHAGMLTACVAHDWPTDDYLAPDHPLQQRVADEVTRLSGEAPVRGRDRRLRRARCSPSRWSRWPAGSARSTPQPTAPSNGRSPTRCGRTRRWSAAPAGRTPG